MFSSRFTAVILTSALAIAGLAGCSSDGHDDDHTIKIGSTDASSKAWATFKDKAKENGINLEISDYKDYTTPNQALAQGVDDVNQFQHLKFLAEFNVGTNNNLIPVGSSFVVPLSLYWKGHDSLEGIEGQQVAIPNDATNQGRAINVLEQAGLLTLKEGDVVTPNPSDIDEAQSKVSVIPVEATQTTHAYGEGKPAIINNNFLERAGIDPATAVYRDDPSSPAAEPYINVFAVKPGRESDPDILKLVELWHSDEVQKAVGEDTKNTAFEVSVEPEKLQEILARLEENASTK